MFMRISSICLPAALLAGCGQKPADPPPQPRAEEPAEEGTLRQIKRWVKGEAPPAPDTRPRIVCAPAGRAEMKDDCRLERIASSDGEDLILHKPDGSFHRVMVVNDGRGLVAADGLARARIKPQPPEAIELTMGGDRFMLPATVKARATPATP